MIILYIYYFPVAFHSCWMYPDPGLQYFRSGAVRTSTAPCLNYSIRTVPPSTFIRSLIESRPTPLLLFG